MTPQVMPQERATILAHQVDAPIDISALATAFGLDVYESYDLGDGISGMIGRDRNSESGYYISVNAAESYLRRRFTIAHEIAHYLLHRDKIGNGLSDDRMYRSDNVSTQEEYQANNLAAELLMPRALMNQAIRHEFSGVHGLARKFEVSEPAMKVRLRYLYQMDIPR